VWVRPSDTAAGRLDAGGREDAGGRLDAGGQARPLVIGHRGASALATENTVEAFARARADGADGVELDVRLTGDGRMVVFHDDDLARLAGRPERIDDTPFARLREVSLSAGGRIPTLEEAYEAVGPELLVNVELKMDGVGAPLQALVDAVVAVVARLDAGERTLVSSFNPWAVRRWMRRAPRVRAGYLFEGRSPLHAFTAAWLRPYALNPELELCTPERVARWRRRGAAVVVWTVDDPAALRACRDMGVAAVIANDPARALAALSAG
jgi:glycerophosphoryl diester phosphodiesterase